MTTVIEDLIFAARHLRRRHAVAGVTATAMFSVVDGVLLGALPYRDARRLVNVWQTFPQWRNHLSVVARLIALVRRRPLELTTITRSTTGESLKFEKAEKFGDIVRRGEGHQRSS